MIFFDGKMGMRKFGSAAPPFSKVACAVSTAVYLYNRTPHSQLQFKTPYQVLKTRYYKYQSIWHITKSKAIGLKKLDPRAKKAILLGFVNNLYRLYDT